MRSVLLVTALLAALAIGCVDHEAPPAPTPTREVSEAIAATATVPTTPGPPESHSSAPIPTPRVLTQQEELCRRPVPVGETGAVVTLSPPAPRGGETVTVTGEHLVPGEYRASLGIPGTDAIVFRDLSIGSVGRDGLLSARFVMPSIGPGFCLRFSISQPRTDFSRPDPTGAAAPAFLSTGNAVSPGPCETLPDTPLPAGGHWARISPPPYRVGSPITVSGEGLGAAVSGLRASLHVYFSTTHDNHAINIDAGSSAWDAEGRYSFAFTPLDAPHLSGLCVEVVAASTSSGNMTDPYGIARFTYP